MSESPDRPEPTRAQCRAAARAVFAAELHDQALDSIRPRGLTGILRSRLPLDRLLYLAALEDRLVWHSADEFAVLEAPRVPKNVVPPPRSTWWLRLLDGIWEPLVAGSVVLGMFMLGVVLAIASGIAGGLGSDTAAGALRSAALGTLAVIGGYTVLLLTVVVVRALIPLWRRLEGRVHRVDELAREPLIDQNWSMPLCHVTAPDQVDGVLRDARRRVRDLVGANRMILCPETAITTSRARQQVSDNPLTTRFSSMDPVLFVLGSPEPGEPETTRRGTVPKADPYIPIQGLTVILLGALSVAAVLADSIAEHERAACAAQSCAGRAVTYPDALIWLLTRMLVFGQWDGTTAVTTYAWVLGSLYILVGLVLYSCIAMAIFRFTRSQSRAIEQVHGALVAETYRAKVLILTAANVEYDAVLASALEVTHAQPRGVPETPYGVVSLGMIGRTELLLAQSGQGTVNPGSMRDTAAALIDHFRPSFVVLTGICFGLRQGEQQLGDVIVCDQLRMTDYRKVTDSPAGTAEVRLRGDQVTLSPALRSRYRAARDGWTGAKLHFGPVLSGNVLMNSAVERAKLIHLDPDAYGGEMEGAGVYAAAVQRKVDWMLVKGISDWGVGKTDDVQQTAARNAADFVMHMITASSVLPYEHNPR